MQKRAAMPASLVHKAHPTSAPFILILGKRGTGKTTLISNILKHQNIPIGVIVTDNSNHYHTLKPKINTELIIHDPPLHDALIDNVIAFQTYVHKKQNIADKRMVVVVDDAFKQQPICKLATNHLSTMVIFSMCFPIGIPPNIRTNIDYIFVFQDTFISNRQRIYEHYFGMIPSFEMFCQIMDEYTDYYDYKCLVIDNTVRSDNLVDRLFWYKAND